MHVSHAFFKHLHTVFIPVHTAHSWVFAFATLGLAMRAIFICTFLFVASVVRIYKIVELLGYSSKWNSIYLYFHWIRIMLCGRLNIVAIAIILIVRIWFYKILVSFFLVRFSLCCVQDDEEMDSPMRRSGIPIPKSKVANSGMKKSLSKSNENLLADNIDPHNQSSNSELDIFTLLEENIALKEKIEELSTKHNTSRIIYTLRITLLKLFW